MEAEAKVCIFIIGIVLGFFLSIILLDADVKEKEADIKRKICIEADWELPSCVAMIEGAIKNAKGG